MKDCVAIDFETYYDSEYSIKKMDVSAYVRDPRFDPYWVAVDADDFTYSGPTSTFNWSLLAGRQLCAHNASFDGFVLKQLGDTGKAPTGLHLNMICTADLAAYCGAERNLKNAAHVFLGQEVGKDVRDNMKGRHLADLSSDELDALRTYAARDAAMSRRLLETLGPRWPAHERQISAWNREAGWRGVPVDIDGVTAGLKTLQQIKFDALQNLPWVTADSDVVLSRPAIRKLCLESGIPMPASFAKTSEDAAQWEAQYSAQFPWVQALRTARTVTPFISRLKSMEALTRDGWMSYGLKYFGAKTGRFSGGSDSSDGDKYNIHNQPRQPVWGVDLRGLLRAPEGYTFVVSDYKNVEAVLLLWTVGDEETLARVREGASVYQAHAERTMGWPREKDIKVEGKKDAQVDAVYRLAKARVLGLNYGCGASKFVIVAKLMAGLELTQAEAQATVDQYRRDNPKITAMWRRMQSGLQASANQRDDTHEIELPSGRVLQYFAPMPISIDVDGRVKREITAVPWLGGSRRKLYGGLLTENYIQALARDVLCYGWSRLMAHSHDVLFHVHDEFVQLCRLEDAEARARETDAILTSELPDWLQGCPIGVDTHSSSRYTKD